MNYSLLEEQVCYDGEKYEEAVYLFLNFLYYISQIAFFTGCFILIDQKVAPKEGKYYFTHAICNFLIVNTTAYEVYQLYMNPYSGLTQTLRIPMLLTYSLHFYHIVLYHFKFRFDDWLHHILMIFVSLPLGNYFGSTRLLSHSLFYTTGLPGMIDYTCLCMVRNDKMERMTEKKINRFLNVWIRNPGCTIHAFLTLIFMNQLTLLQDQIFAFITMALVFWNGNYFMDQVVGNYYLLKNK